jgi:hypothetical protein
LSSIGRKRKRKEGNQPTRQKIDSPQESQTQIKRKEAGKQGSAHQICPVTK